MMIRIKDTFIVEENINSAMFDEYNKEIIIHMKNGMMIPFGLEMKQQLIPRGRVITAAEFEEIKSYFSIELKTKIIV